MNSGSSVRCRSLMTASAMFCDLMISICVSTVAESMGRSPNGDTCLEKLRLVGVDDQHRMAGIARRRREE